MARSKEWRIGRSPRHDFYDLAGARLPVALVGNATTLNNYFEASTNSK